jgi:PKD repeat protein
MKTRVTLALLPGILLLLALAGSAGALGGRAAAAPSGPDSNRSSMTDPIDQDAPQAQPLEPALAPDATGRASGKGGDMLISTSAGMDYGFSSESAIAYNSLDGEYLVVWSDAREPFHILYVQLYSAQGVPIGENRSISSAELAQQWPAIAHNRTVNEYLVVWSQGGSIYGRRLSPDAAPLGDTFVIGSQPGHQASAVVVYNRVDNEYLVVWEDSRNFAENGWDIYGQRLHPNGSPVEPDFSIVAVNPYQDEVFPDVAFNAVDNDYLVVWERIGSGGPFIEGARVDSDGTLIGLPWPMGDPESNQEAPAVTWDSYRDEYFVVWRDLPGVDVYGQRFHSDGSQDQGAVKIATTHMALAIDVAYDWNQHQYLVVWQDDRNRSSTEDDIYGRRVVIVDGKARPAGQGEYLIGGAPHDQKYPAVAYGGAGAQFLVTWDDHRNDETSPIYGQRVSWSGMLLGHSFALNAARGTQDEPAAAYNDRSHEYLAVWADERSGQFDIYGQILDVDGLPLGEGLLLVDSAGNQTHPSVTYNRIEDEYLLAWEQETGVYALRLRPQGTPVGAAFPVFNVTGIRREPVVVCAATLNRYLVAYTYGANGAREVRGALIDSTGGLLASDLLIAPGAGDRDQIDATFDSIYSRFIVVWRDTHDDAGDVYARLLESDGSMPSTRFQVAVAADAQGAPAVAWDRDDDMYLVVWHDYRNSGATGADIYGQRFEATGNPEGGNFLITASAALHDEEYPDVVYIETLDRYRVVWQDNRDAATLGWDLRGRWVGPDGSVLGLVDDPIFRYAGYQERPALAYAPADEQLLAVWQDGRNGIEYDVFGRLVLDKTPPTAAFTRDPNYGRAGDLFTFNAGPSRDNMTPKGALLVRWDLNNDGVWDTPLGTQKLISLTLNATGIHTVTLEVQDLALYTDKVSHRVAVLPAAAAARAPQAEPPSAALVVDPTFGVAGSTFSADGTGSTGSGALVARWDWENDGVFDPAEFTADLDAEHVYTEAGDYTVRLEVRDQSTGLSNAALYNITVLPGDPVALEVLPAGVKLAPNEALRFRAVGWDEYDNEMEGLDVEWSVADAQAGGISAEGLFTAGTHAGAYPDGIHAAWDGVASKASVTVFWPYQDYLPVVLR